MTFPMWHHAVLPARVLLAGALIGFSKKEAKVILLDPDCLAFLRGLWTTYWTQAPDGQRTRSGLPPAFESLLAREQRRHGKRWNLLVVRQSGWRAPGDCCPKNHQ